MAMSGASSARLYGRFPYLAWRGSAGGCWLPVCKPHGRC